MLVSMLHGLGIRRNPTPVQNTYATLIADAFNAPIGKTYGNYTLDSLSEKTLINTINLPDVSGYLKQVQVDFLIERSTTPNGDFVIATAKPFFPSNLGTPIIDKQYLDALSGRKYISFQQDNSWSSWKEINSSSDNLATFVMQDTGELNTIYIDPVSIREYFITLEPSTQVKLDVQENSRFDRNVYIDIDPESSVYLLSWSDNILWVQNNLQPPPVTGTERIRVILNKSGDNFIHGRYEIYKAV